MYNAGMKHCQYCGGSLEATNKTKHICQACGKDSYNTPRAAAAVVIGDGHGQYCFAVRAHEPERGKLDCIGGFVDYGETAEEAIIREMEEEAGLLPEHVRNLRYLGSAFDEYMWHGQPEPVHTTYFIAELVPGTELTADDDVASFVWMPLERLGHDGVAWPGMEHVLRRLIV